MKIKRDLIDFIKSFYSFVPPERGGILGMKNGIICDYVHDSSVGELNNAVYFPNTVFLNQSIEKWSDDGIDFCGIVHSHPVGQDSLSSGDLEYIMVLYETNPGLEKTFFPLVLNGCDIIVYAAERKNDGIKITVDSIETVV